MNAIKKIVLSVNYQISTTTYIIIVDHDISTSCIDNRPVSLWMRAEIKRVC